MKRILLTWAEIKILLLVQDYVCFDYSEPDEFLDQCIKNEEKDAEMCFKTEVFEDVIDSLEIYVEDDENPQLEEAKALLEKIRAVEEEPAG